MVKERYQRIVNQLIKKSFPELKVREVGVIEFSRFFIVWSFAQKIFGKYYIFMNKIRRNASVKSLKGQLAHELCHIILDHMNKTMLGDFWHNTRKILSFIFNTDFSRKIEIKIDKETIRRGYAKERLESTFDMEKKFSKKKELIYSRGYLTPEQTKKYAKKIGKW